MDFHVWIEMFRKGCFTRCWLMKPRHRVESNGAILAESISYITCLYPWASSSRMKLPFVSMKQNWPGHHSDLVGQSLNRNVPFGHTITLKSFRRISLCIDTQNLRGKICLFVGVSDLNIQKNKIKCTKAQLSRNLCAWRSVGGCQRALRKELCLSMFVYNHPSF